jgi:transglutaminase-like putative cysteine protease
LRQPGFSESDFAENINGWVYQEIAYQLVMGWFTSEEVLDMKGGKCLDKANLYMAITRTAGMPTRGVDGFLIIDQLSPTFQDIAGMTPDGKYIVGHAWAEVYLSGEGWVFADPTNDLFRTNLFSAEIYSSVEQTWQEVLASYETSYGELI